MKNMKNLDLYIQNYREVTYRIGLTEDELHLIKKAIAGYLYDYEEDSKVWDWMNTEYDKMLMGNLRKLLEELNSLPF